MFSHLPYFIEVLTFHLLTPISLGLSKKVELTTWYKVVVNQPYLSLRQNNVHNIADLCWVEIEVYSRKSRPDLYSHSRLMQNGRDPGGKSIDVTRSTARRNDTKVGRIMINMLPNVAVNRL